MKRRKNSFTKSELARIAGVSPSTFRRWLRLVEQNIPLYQRRQKVLTPRQVQCIRRMLYIDEEENN